MSITRLISSVSALVLLSWTAKNKIDHPNASLMESVPIVDIYKTVLSMHLKNLKDAQQAMDKGDAPDAPGGPVTSGSPAQSASGHHHFKHDRTGQTLDMGNGLEPTAGSNPLNRGPYKKYGDNRGL